jgi:hypothetical protein
MVFSLVISYDTIIKFIQSVPYQFLNILACSFIHATKPNSLGAKNAKTERQQSAAYQQSKGYHAWRNKNKYGRRELVENTFFRFKSSFGSKFLSRDDDNMKNEMTIKCQLLNKMFEIGKPISTRVA